MSMLFIFLCFQLFRSFTLISCALINSYQLIKSNSNHTTVVTNKKVLSDLKFFAENLWEHQHQQPKQQQQSSISQYKHVFALFDKSDARKTRKKENECAENLKRENGKDWQCRLKYAKSSTKSSSSSRGERKPLFFNCLYEYDCDPENQRFYFSLNYLRKLRAENRLKNIDRGPDYQCERLLRKQTSRLWTCSLREEVNSNMLDKNDVFYCDCYFQNKCKHQRLVDV